MDSSRASSVNASSHLSSVPSKHDAKCRRVPRIICRRLYRYRRTVPLQKTFACSSNSYPPPNDKEISPGFFDLPNLEETLLSLLTKYPTSKRSYSTDGDPLILFRSEMNKSTFFNHNLMKRRYSVPETIMRKHKLQENLYKKDANDAATSAPRDPKMAELIDDEMNVRDESCQTDEYFDYYANSFKNNGSFRKNFKCRKRDSVRHFRKCNSYCQYKSLSMFHKKMSNRQREVHSLGSFETLANVEQTRKKEQNTPTARSERETKCNSQELPAIAPKSDDLLRDKFVDLLLDEKSKNTREVNDLQKSHSDKTISPFTRLSPIVRQYSYPPFLHSLESSKYLFEFPSKPKIIFSENGESNIKNVEMFSFVHRPEKVFVKSAKSLDQNTSGYSTVNGSLDETPRRKTPETPKFESATAREKTQKSNDKSTYENERKSTDTFPITFHSESVFLHPYENGFLSHKELHHISIQKVPDCSIKTSNDANFPHDYHKTEIKLNVNEFNMTPRGDEKTADEAGKKSAGEKQNKVSDTIPRDSSGKSETLDLKECFGTKASHKQNEKINVQTDIPRAKQEGIKSETQRAPEEGCSNDDTSSIRSDDCTVPAQGPPFKGDEQSKLKIEVDIADINLTRSLQEVLAGRRVAARRASAEKESHSHTDETRHQSNKYNSKTALNYLFQKLGDTYPKRSLLKQPSFHEDHSRYGPYYSDLPKIDYPHIPPKVLFNNQTYDILSEKLLPSERSTGSVSKRYDSSDIVFPNLSRIRRLSADGDERLSDSDTSIPDSLEDFQQTKSKYNKYDERLARGEVRHRKARVKFNKCRGSISYFIPLDELNARQNNVMPAKLMEKLRQRGRSISKHSACIDSRRRPFKPTKLLHKQIQTSFNAENSPKKRRTRNPAVKESTKVSDRRSNDADLDERIMTILLSGLRMQDDDDEPPKTGRNRKDANVEVQTFKDTSSRSVQTEAAELINEPVMSEYVEILKVSSPVNDVRPMPDDKDEEPPANESFSQTDERSADSPYEVIQSEEEIAKINSTNYYRSIKKSRRIYYPTKFENKRFSYDHKNNESSLALSCQNIPSFSKYQKNLKEFREQMRKQNNDKANATNFGDSTQNARGHDGALQPYQHLRMRKLKDKHQFKNLVSKISGSRLNRFRQRFEAIPEETSSYSSEAIDQNRDTLRRGIAEEKSEPNASQSVNSTKSSNDGNDLNRIEPLIVTSCNENQIAAKSSYHDENENDLAKCVQQDEYKGKVKSQKGRDSLSAVNEQEELITLSRGWINFYLLNGNNTEENIGTNEEPENEDTTLSETFCIPQQYTVHVHAKPEIPSIQVHKSKSNSLPGLDKSSKNRTTKFGRTKQNSKTNSLPDVGGNAHSDQKAYDINSNGKQRHLLPKLNRNDPASITSGEGKLEETHSHVESNLEPVSTRQNFSHIEKSPSTAVSSNHSVSSIDELTEKNKIERLHKHQRPHTYHSSRTNNQWSVTIEGSHAYEERMESDIEMQLCLKNNPRGSSVSNQFWKFSIRNEEMSQSNGFDERRINGRSLPHLNVCYRRPALRINEDENSNYFDNDNNTRSNSALSFHDRIEFNKFDHSPQNHKRNGRFGTDLKTQLKSSDDDLTVTGSAITPERKCRVPVLSERDLYRMKLIKQVSVEHKLM